MRSADPDQPTRLRAGPSRWTSGAAGRLVGALILGTLATAVWTYPLIDRIDDSITTATPEAGFADADQILSLWIVNEGGRRLYRDPLHVFDANIFHPMRHTLAYSESMLAAGAIVAPLRALLGNPILAFNLYFLATLVLSFVGVFLLVREITSDDRAAALAALFFAFTTDRWAIPTHLPAQSVHCIPWVLYFWIRSLSSPRIGNHLGLGLALGANYLHSVYYGLMLPVLLLPWAAVLAASGRWPLGNWLRASAVAGAATGLSLPAYLPYVAVARETGYIAIPPDTASASWYWGGLTHPLAYAASLFAESRHPIAASPWPLVCLALAGVVTSLRPRRSAAPPAEGTHALAMTAFFIAAVLVSLGRTIDVGVRLPGPFRLLWALPGFSSFRTTGRLLIFATFSLTVLGGIGIAASLRRMSSRTGVAIVTTVLAVTVAIDTRLFGPAWPLSHLIPPADVPPVYRWLATTPRDTAVLELPYGQWSDDARAMFLSLYHGRRLMNGYSARFPYFGEAVLRFPDAIAVRTLQDAGVAYVLAHRDRLAADPAAARRLVTMEQRTDLLPRWIGSTLVLTIPPATSQRIDPPGRLLDPSRWRLTGNRSGTERAVDGDLDTHWVARITAQGSFLRIDLGARERLVGVVLRMGPHFLEYPRRYTLWASLDGSSWRRVGASHPVTLPPFASYRHDHVDVRVPLKLRPVEARHLEIRIPARRVGRTRDDRSDLLSTLLHQARDPNAFPEARWGVHEIEIYAAPTDGSDHERTPRRVRAPAS